MTTPPSFMTEPKTDQPEPKKKKKDKKNKGGNWLTASTSDKHDLYEQSVQEPEAEVDFIDEVWQERRGRLARSIREDFCGTGIAACQWVKHRSGNTATCVDIDPHVLTIARKRVKERLTDDQASRIRLIEGDVLATEADPVDSVLAMNFSYYLFKTRETLRTYFERARAALVSDGIFICDAYGGSESFEEMEEERDCDGFTYVWDQAKYNPITGDAVNHIHFRFPDGTEMTEAFSYHWRLWTLPEIQELLYEAGFKKVAVYWEGTDEDDEEEGNGEFTPTTEGEACAGWITYIVAEN